ncbi:MAG: PAS domain S-box protein [Melioribacteraceae bacterium]|nr:PAS domain S-box protein [Melioribacteraceae bacterium]MCF8264307.1 PAS domain S-box protein [Melioribacteraceae bacterium]MCF8431418.1 PAS domain S-box protein [Melioribacteraceae bacterium]
MKEDIKNTEFINMTSLIENLPVGLLIFNSEFKVLHVNRNFYLFDVINNLSASSIHGKDIIQTGLFDYADVSEELKELTAGIPFEKELLNTKTSEGKELKVIVKGSPLMKNGKFDGGLLILQDVKIDSTLQSDTILKSADFRKTIGLLTDHYLLTDTEGRILFNQIRNKRISNNLYQKINDNVFDIIPEEQKGKLLIQLNLSFEKREDQSNFYSIDGKSIEIISIPYAHQDGGKFVLILFKDQTEQIQQEESYEKELEELQYYQAITSNVVDAIVSVNLNGEIIFWNDSAQNLFGFRKSMVYKKHIGKVIGSINPNYFNQIKNELIKNKTWESEFKIKPSSGDEKTILVRFGSSGDKSESIVILCTNISERFELERSLRLSEAKYRSIVTNTHEYICTLDLDGVINYVNPFFIEKFGYKENEFIGQSIYYFMEGGDKIDLETLAKPGISEPTKELKLKTKTGAVRYVNANLSTVYDLNNKPEYFNAILTDITETKEAERDLLLIQSVFNVSQDGISVQEGDTLILTNKAFNSIYDIPEETDLGGKHHLDFVHADDRKMMQELTARIFGGKDYQERVEFKVVTPKGQNRLIEETITTFQAGGQKFIVRVDRDITESKEAQKALRESEEKYRSVAENITEGMWKAERINGKLRTVFYTEAISQITGYKNDRFILDQLFWAHLIHPEDLHFTLKRLKSFYRDVTRSAGEFEYRIINKFGASVWIKNKITLIRSSDGVIQKIYGVVSDISLSKRAEEELKRSADDLARLNETKDRLLSIISHDLRSPFSSIIGFTDLMLKNENLPVEKRTEYVGFVNDSAKTILELVNSLLDWTRIQTGRVKFEPDRLNMKKLVEKTFVLLRGAAMQKDIQFENEIVNDTFAHGDENLIIQLLSNLISNSIKFTPKGGKISISAVANIEEKQVEFHVKDTGTGIKDSDIDKLFRVDAKFTSRGTEGEKGTGLGLSLCYDIVKKHGGEIRVESEFGHGSDFIFSLPVSSTNILLVDDGKTDRLLYTKLLRNFFPRYQVLEAKDGKEALEIVKESSPALIITDHYMPVINGYEFVKKLKSLDVKYIPPVIVLSIDLNDGIIESYKELGLEFIFQKPVNLAAFRIAVDKSLKKSIFS